MRGYGSGGDDSAACKKGLKAAKVDRSEAEDARVEAERAPVDMR